MSFRLRIALLALATSGVVLLAVGVSLLAVSQRVGLERVDREIRAIADGQLRHWHPADHWADVDRSLAFVYGTEGAARPALVVKDAGGTRLFVSADAPRDIVNLTLPALPWLDGGDAGPGPAPFVGRLDLDGDGRVSAAEFDGPADQFPAFDADGNGFIDEGEARRAFAGDAPHPPGAEDAPRPGPPVRQKAARFLTLEAADGGWRVGVLGNEYVTMAVGLSLADFRRDAARVQAAFAGSAAVALLLLAAGGWFLATRALTPVAAIVGLADTLRASDLHRRIPNTAVEAEFRQLIDVLNGMLERLESSFRQAERFSADAAHELQTPLTVIQGELDTAIQRAPAGSDEQRAFGDALEEVRRLEAIVHKLLLLARADAGRLALSPTRVDASALVADAVDDLQALAPAALVESAIEPGLVLTTDRELLNHVVLNLVSNAAKYTPDGGSIRVELAGDGTGIRLSVANSGNPIPGAEHERVFDRFYRRDASRTRAAGGSGLGLSLARELARALGGDLALHQGPPDTNTFTLTLPAAPRLE